MKILLKSLFYTLLSLTCISIFAQEQLDKYYLFKNYNTRNGLINNLIYSMAMDKHGFVWIGSDLGLSRFDGKSFYNNAIPEINDKSASIYNLGTVDNGNMICAAFMQGIYKQIDDGSFKNYYTLPKSIKKNIFFTSKQGSDGTIFLGGSQGLFKINGDSLTLIYDSGIIRMFYTLDVDGSNNLWFGGINGLGIIETDNSGLKPFFIPELEGNFIISMHFDNQGVLHAGTSQGYFRVEFEEPFHPGSKYHISQPIDEISELNINKIYLDNEQNIWIPTSSNGVYRIKGDSVTMHLTTNNGMLSSNVLCMTQDKEGNYYFGTDNGISVVKDFNSYALAKNGKIFQDVFNILADKYDRIWMNCFGGLTIFQNGRLYSIDLKNTLLEKRGVSSFFINEQSEMWFFNEKELFKMKLTEPFPDLKKVERVTDISHYNSSDIFSRFVDANGVWLCTRDLLFNYQYDRILPVTFNHPDSSAIDYYSITSDKFGYYWIVDYNSVLYRATMTENSKNKVVFDDFISYKSLNADSAFVTAWIDDIMIDKEGYLWQTSSYTGVYKHTLDSTGVVSSKLYSTENGLLSNNVYDVGQTQDGRIWMHTQKGICILTQGDDGGEHFDYLDEKAGIVGQPINTALTENQLFTLTDEGFFVTPNKFSEETKEIIPKVVITGLTVDGADYTSWVNKNETLPLSFNQNNLMFDFSSITFNNADEITYQYKLDDIDDEWSELYNRGYKEYTSLGPGKYTFYVRTISKYGISGEETMFKFRIGRAYYQTVWFYLLICAFISALVYIFYKNRINNVIKTERIRSRIAADLHDDIGSTLSSIFLMSEISVSKNKQSILEEILQKISANSREILNSMDDIIWSVKPQEDSLDNLIIRLREYAIPLCESKGISIYMNIEPSISSLKLEMDERRNIYLITKESINNAIKHSGCSKLEVTFSAKNRQIEVIINDNGIGFDPKSPTSRNGMLNMKRRAQQIGREVVILSEKGKGTTLRLKTKNHI